MTLLTSFIAWPAPTSPQWNTFGLIASKVSRMRANCASVPPAMIAMVPASAPCGPPETGASISSSPRSASSAAMARVAFGSPVVWSTMIPPGAMPAASPPSPKIASRTSFEVGRQSSTASQDWPSASRLCAGCAPAAAMSRTASGLRSKALSLRLTSSRLASAPPMFPRPTYPSSMDRAPSLPRHPLGRQ